jgi:hypothetical protein
MSASAIGMPACVKHAFSPLLARFVRCGGSRKTVARSRFLIDVSPKCRVPHIHGTPALPIAQINSKNASKHNDAEHCARHDRRQNPIANCPGRPQFHRPQRGSQYDNSDYESHMNALSVFTEEHDSWTCACLLLLKKSEVKNSCQADAVPAPCEKAAPSIEVYRLVCSQNGSLAVGRLASFDPRRTVMQRKCSQPACCLGKRHAYHLAPVSRTGCHPRCGSGLLQARR